MRDMRSTGRFIALILRHRPEAVGIVLDEHGWAKADELVGGINATGHRRLTKELLGAMVRTEERQR